MPLAALNTLVLLTSSLTVVQAYGAAERGDAGGFRWNLLATIALGLAFLTIKAFEYTGKIQAGYTPGAGIFWSFYYTLTELHALHVLAGLILNGLLFAVAGTERPDRVELAGLYWHFVGGGREGTGLNPGFYWSAVVLTVLPFVVVVVAGAWLRRQLSAAGRRSVPGSAVEPGSPGESA